MTEATGLFRCPDLAKMRRAEGVIGQSTGQANDLDRSGSGRQKGMPFGLKENTQHLPLLLLSSLILSCPRRAFTTDFPRLPQNARI